MCVLTVNSDEGNFQYTKKMRRFNSENENLVFS